jgi:ABC-type sugar transport system substrate-binding protein
VVFVISMTSSILSFGLTWRTVIITAFVVTLVLSLGANIIFVLESRHQGKVAKQIAFLTPSSGDQPFYDSMLSCLIRNASLALGQNYVVIPSMPTQPFEAVSIWALFSNLEDSLDIDGIMFIPDDPDGHFDELVRFNEEHSDIPLLLLDVYFDLDQCDERTQKRLPSFVGGDEKAGGELAADIAADAVGRIPADPVALIVNGGLAPWERQRAVAFRKRLASLWPGTTFLETPPVNYSRRGAFDAVIDVLRREAGAARLISVDTVFACNDDMAIGTRRAITRLLSDGYQFPEPPQIVGYDGISEIREYLHAGDRYIAGTVDVQISEQAKAAMLLMHKLLRSEERSREVKLIVPVAVRRHAAYQE